MTTSRLTIYNNALLECGERELAPLAENREPRRLLDRVWDGGAVDYCLGQGMWKFAKRTVELAPEVSITPGFGYSNAYEIPTDFIRTAAISADEYLQTPLLQYTQEQNYWFADVSPLYVSYISNDANYGGDLSLWPLDFTRYVEAYLASMIVRRLTQNESDWERLFKLAAFRLKEARSSDAMEGPSTFPPQGSWVSARRGRSSGRYERGNRGSLTG